MHWQTEILQHMDCEQCSSLWFGLLLVEDGQAWEHSLQWCLRVHGGGDGGWSFTTIGPIGDDYDSAADQD